MAKIDLVSRGRRTNTVALGIAGAVLLVIVVASYREWADDNLANTAATESRQITAASERVLASVLDAETGQRGYLLTGEQHYLDPYNQAVRELPQERANLGRLFGARPGGTDQFNQLDTLVGREMTELAQTLDVQRSEGTAAALAVVRSDQGRQTMEAIRELCAQIQSAEGPRQNQISMDRQTAVRQILLFTVTGALVLLFLFAVGLEPFVSSDPRAQSHSWPLRFGVAVVATAASALLRHVLAPFVGPGELALSIFIPAVLVSAWFGGFRAGTLSIVLSVAAATVFFGEHPGYGLLNFIVITFGLALLSDAQRRSLGRAREAEYAERLARERFETTLESIGDAVIATDSKGRVNFANRAAASLVGMPEAEMQGQPVEEVLRIVNEDTRASVENPVRRVLSEGIVMGLANHTLLISHDGKELPIDDSAAPIVDKRKPGGGARPVEGAVLVFRDITERRKTEEASRLLASIAESSDDAIISKDLNGIITSWNKGAERIFGYTAGEMIGQSISRIAPPDRRNEMPEILTRIRRGESLEHFRTLRQTKNGRIIHAAITVSPMYDPQGAVAGAAKIIRDVTAEVEAESMIAEQRERLQVILNSIGDGVIAAGVDGRVSWLNPVAEALTGWRAEEARGRPIEEVFRIIGEDTREPVESPVGPVLRDGVRASLAGNTLLVSRDGREISIDDSAAPIRDPGGKNTGVVLVFRDVTESRKADDASHLLASITESSDDAIIGQSLQGIVTTWNKSAERILGYTEKEMIGQPIATIAPLDRVDETPGILARIRRGERLQHFHTRRRRKDGRIIHVSITVSPIYAPRGDPKGTIVGASKILRDISAEVEADAIIAEQRERMQVTLNSIADAVIATDLDSRISYMNPVAEQLTGWSAEEASGRRLEEVLRIIDEERRQPAESPVSRVLREGVVTGRADHALLIARQGREIAVDESAAPLRDTRGETVGIVLIFRDISARKRTEDELRRRKEELEALSDATPAYIWFAHDPECRRITGNAAANRLFGLAPGTNVSAVPGTGEFDAKHFTPDGYEIPFDERPMRLAIASAHPISDVEVEYRPAGRQPVHVLGNVAPLFDSDGKVRGCVSVYLDITQRKDAERRLAHVQGQLAWELAGMRRLHELGGRLVNQKDLPSLLSEILNAAQAIVGADKGIVQLLDEKGVLRIAASNGFSTEYLEFFKVIHANEWASGTTMALREQTVIENVEKSPFYIGTPALEIMRSAGVWAAQSTPMISHRGTVVGVLSTHYSEVWKPSERDLRLLDLLAKQAADLIEKLSAEEALRRSEERLATVLEHLPVGVGVTDWQGYIQVSNPAWQRFRESTPTSEGKESARWEGISAADDPVIRALRGEEVLPGMDFFRSTVGEEARWTRISAVPLRDADEQVIGALVLIRDIDEERRAEERRVELAAKERALTAEKALREIETDLARVTRALSVGEMASTIAHEVNQPLAGVVINAEAGLRWLNNQPPGLDEARESLTLIARDGIRASAMIRRIREFLRKDSRQSISLDINEAIQEAVAITQAELVKRGVALRIEAPNGLPRIHGDRIQLQQVVLNLLINGADAMADVKGPKDLLLATEESEGRLVVAVRDRGAGVPPQNMRQMFQAFFTTKSTGMGMGLSICRSIVEAHAGRIWAENNTDGPGLTVRFALPTEQGSAGAGSPEARSLAEGGA